MTAKTNHHAIFFFQRCLQISKVLECHTEICLLINHTKSSLLHEEGEYVNFQNFERLD